MALPERTSEAYLMQADFYVKLYFNSCYIGISIILGMLRFLDIGSLALFIFLLCFDFTFLFGLFLVLQELGLFYK